MFSEPIALLTYKRPELTKNIINIILSLEPRKFYIIQDGPKKDFSQKDKRLFELKDWHLYFSQNYWFKYYLKIKFIS